jgi:pilus assembly protein Flp/PilA
MLMILIALRRLAGNRKAATATEYGLVLAFVVIAMMVGLVAVADATNAMWGKVSTTVSTVMD